MVITINADNDQSFMKSIRKLKIILFTLALGYFLPITMFSAHAPKPIIKSIPVAQALHRAAQVLRGNQLDLARKYINELSQGGMTIQEKHVEPIINRVLNQTSGLAKPGATPTQKPADKKETKDPELEKAIQASLKEKKEADALDTLLKNLSLANTPPHQPPTREQNKSLIPAGLQGKITYVKTQKQVKNECGSRATYAAKIVSQIPHPENMDAKAIAEKINREIKKFDTAKKICYFIIDDKKIIEMANQEHIKNFYVIQYGKLEGIYKPLILQRTAGSLESIDVMYDRLKNSKMKEQGYFVFNTGDPQKGGYHWVLVAAIKPTGKRVQLWYFDSLNHRIMPGSFIYKALYQLAKDMGL